MMMLLLMIIGRDSHQRSMFGGVAVQERIAHRDLEKREAELRASYDRLLDENQNLKTAMKKRTVLVCFLWSQGRGGRRIPSVVAA